MITEREDSVWSIFEVLTSERKNELLPVELNYFGKLRELRK